jgi:hypothetical protein
MTPGADRPLDEWVTNCYPHDMIFERQPGPLETTMQNMS